ncbi:MAG: serine/threonine protein kinase [Proteobacteria bacterium]|nr:serine/threonine protein kinase [Pseudomonadota bacterium]
MPDTLASRTENPAKEPCAHANDGMHTAQDLGEAPDITETCDDENHDITETCTEEKPCVTPPELADRYRFICELGAGAQGHVFKAECLSTGKLVAIKQLRIDSIKTWKEYTLFHREADVLATLDMPGIVKLHEACDCLDVNPPCSYIVQEYIEGSTLKAILKSGYRFSIAQIYDFVLQLIDILEKLRTHEPPVVHRDIKPSNIILKSLQGDRFEVWLIDFGAVSNPQVQSGGSTIAGTFGYMSPEQNLGRAVPESDTYALGALTAYLLSGVDPAEMTFKDLRLIIDPYVENHPRALVQTLNQMLEPNIANRLSDIQTLRARFQAFSKGIYNLSSVENKPTAQTIKRALKRVQYLCQPQNLDIWQALPDDPKDRPDIDTEFFVTFPRFKKYDTYKSIYEDTSDVKDTAILEAIVLIIITLFFLILATITDLFILIIFAIAPWFIWSTLGESSPVKSNALARILIKNYIKSQTCPDHLLAYRHGYKTIATITDIRYIPCNEQMINTEGHVSIPRMETPPTFRIWYKFNPPDDDNPNDLIHYINIHSDPIGLFKSGDPLPILYVKYQDLPKDTHTPQNDTPPSPHTVILSMPYPFPRSDLNQCTDYIYRGATHTS